MSEIRVQRKQQHLQIARAASKGNQQSLLEDIRLLPSTLTELSINDIDLSTTLGGKRLEIPIIINAMTGGCQEAAGINYRLGKLAAATGLGMAVGSQHAAFDNKELQPTYQAARQANPEGLIWGNVSAHATIDQAYQAVDMVKADGLQIHLNQAQELAMPEGEREFAGLKANLKNLAAQCPVPVIAKQTGNGIAKEEAQELKELGFPILDIGGFGGTNFIGIENRRGGLLGESLENWGLPTAISLVEALTVRDLEIVASGGIRSALDIARSLALGAAAAGMALPFLHLTAYSDEDMLAATQRLIYQLKSIFLLCNARNIEELRQRPLIITGRTREWMQIRKLTMR